MDEKVCTGKRQSAMQGGKQWDTVLCPTEEETYKRELIGDYEADEVARDGVVSGAMGVDRKTLRGKQGRLSTRG